MAYSQSEDLAAQVKVVSTSWPHPGCWLPGHSPAYDIATSKCLAVVLPTDTALSVHCAAWGDCLAVWTLQLGAQHVYLNNVCWQFGCVCGCCAQQSHVTIMLQNMSMAPLQLLNSCIALL